jgi:hypothetical protein
VDRKELESIAASNHYLRGLLAIPVGVVLVAAALGNMEWGPFRRFWTVPACIAVAAGAYALIVRHYNEHYGRALPRMGVRRELGIAAAVVVMGGGPAVVQALDLPLNGLALVWAVVALAYYGTTVGLRAHHVVIWVAVLAASLVPLWPDPRTSNTYNTAMLIVGAAVMLTGVLDHRLLVRTFGSPRGFDVTDSSARA